MAKTPQKKTTLQQFMRDTYYTMSLGLLVSAMVAYLVEHVPRVGSILLGFPLVIACIMAPLIFVWLGFSRQRIERMEARKINICYFAYAAAMGVSLTAVFGMFLYSYKVMGLLFLIAAIAFAAAALFGQITKHAIGKTESLLVMLATGGLFLIGTTHYMGLGMVQIIVCIIVLAAFTGIAAWEEHILRETYDHGLNLNDPLRLSVTGAFIMYMGFMGLFEVFIGVGSSRKKPR